MPLDKKKLDELVALFSSRITNWNDFSDPRFVKDEIDYKQATISKARNLLSEGELEKLIEEDKFDEFIDRLVIIGKDNNLLWNSVPSKGDLSIISESDLDKPGFCNAVFDLLYGTASSQERLGRYTEYVRSKGHQNKWTFPTYFLFICHPETEIFVKPTVTQWFLQYLDAEFKYRSVPNAEDYDAIRGTYQQLRDELKNYRPKDMVDIQSFVWTCWDIYKSSINIWWVNQGTYLNDEKEGGYLWAPTESKSGRSIYHWNTMLEVKTNDIILHYSNGSLRYVSQALSPAEIAGDPHDDQSAEKYIQNGHLVRVEYHDLNPPVALNKFSDEILRLNIDQGPINGFGAVKQGYLFRLVPEALRIIRKSQPNSSWPKFIEDFLAISHWIFQANPRYYDIDGALGELTENTWLITRYSNEIKTGDIVFIWESGIDGGILAVASVLTKPDHIPEDKDEEKFIKDEERFEGERLRVRLRIDHVLSEKLSRGTLANHPVISSNEIFRFANATNFRVTEEQARAINDLIFSNPPTPNNKGFILRIKSILERKGQVILYGPPGTGKTYWAEKAACELAAQSNFGCGFDQLSPHQKSLITGDGESFGSVRTCCFHPAYGYEDFIEGYRPEQADGQMIFSLRDGVFKRLCKDALDNPQTSFYLIIDEINRGDIPRIFGELMTIIEKDKRGKSITLPTSGEQFLVPSNVYIIGTMNTADRSIALLDAALRRRFGFIELMPDPSVLGGTIIDGIHLGRWLEALNQKICKNVARDARNLQIGHSYLLKEDGTPIDDFSEFARALHEDIIPLLEEYCYEDYSTLEKILGSDIVDVDGQKIRHELFKPYARDDLIQIIWRVLINNGTEE